MSFEKSAKKPIDLRAPDQRDAWTDQAKSFETAEYKADWGLAGMNASYAYALGMTGKGVKLGEVDSGIFIGHSEFQGGRIHPVEVKGTYGSDGYRYEKWTYDPATNKWSFIEPIQSSTFKAGQAFDVPGAYDPKYNDEHGTHVGGTIAANRDGKGMHGVAFDGDLYVASTGGTDDMADGPNNDYTYFLKAYGAVAEAGARVINTSWGQDGSGADYKSVQGLMSTYAMYWGKKSWLDAVAETVKTYGEIQTFAGGNDYDTRVPVLSAALPYMRPDLEANWIAVGAEAPPDNHEDSSPETVGWRPWPNEPGIAKYWSVLAPGESILSSVPVVTDGGNVTSGYDTWGGTSMSSPHATGALGLVMQRYAYLDNHGARDVLLTTAKHHDAVEGTPDDTTGLAKDDAPNDRWGWGAIDLKAAMDGPGQFLGAFNVNMTKDQSDTWHNSITEDALIQRKREDTAEQAAWQQTLKQKGWDTAPPTAASSIDDQVAYAVGTARATAAAQRVYQGSLVKNGEGTLTLDGAGSTYSGGTFLNGGTIELGAQDAAGTGTIHFGKGAQTLQIDLAALDTDDDNRLSNVIDGFSTDGDVIDVSGIGSKATLGFNYGTDTLTLSDPGAAGARRATLTLSGDYAGKFFTAASDGAGGIKVGLVNAVATAQTRAPGHAAEWDKLAATYASAEYSADWGLAGMNASYAYALGFTGKGVKLGEVDSGIDIDHPEFQGGRIHPLDIKGTYYADGYRYENGGWSFQDGDWHWVSEGPKESSAYTAGESFDTPGIYDGHYNDAHGTHVGGTIAASRDGKGMHGVAYEADLYVANTAGTDSSLYGPQGDYNYYKAAYGKVAASGARAINTSWGTPPISDKYSKLADLTAAYKEFFGKKTHLDAMGEVSKATGVLQVIAAGNDSATNPDIRNSLPYFRPDLEKYWISVGASGSSGKADPSNVGIVDFSDLGGVGKYWMIFAPGGDIDSTVPQAKADDVWDHAEWGVDPDKQTGYTSVSGTSMAAPHATGALGVIMQRYSYLDNQGARTVLLTTAQHRDAVDGKADDTKGLAKDDAPNAVWGWGAIDLKAAMNGPGQFLGAFNVNMTKAQSDVWNNSITEDALIQRKREDAVEQAAWKATLKQKGWDKRPPNASSSIDDQLAYAVGTSRATAAAQRVYQGSLVKNGEGTLTLNGAGSTYSGGTFLNGGTLELGAQGAAGTGAIHFGKGAQTLQIDQAALGADAGHSLCNLIDGFAADGDVIDLAGIGSNAFAFFDDFSDTLEVIDPTKHGACVATLKLSGDYTGDFFQTASDGKGGLKISLFDPAADLIADWAKHKPHHYAFNQADIGLGSLISGKNARADAFHSGLEHTAWASRNSDSHKWFAASPLHHAA
ncbi:hypothetical protein BJF93_01685 [Xaviernesmea oryzae]|uniref:Peptidase S8/S53 domain-containing protein n=1 Tax=Xaviernesmea oryzae TaxID=464029 RepID=A0A1Q9B3C4_9HYPH|nr:S8 family serine peptidase [Xaviernesmea oryzae]OLP62533.1 hypothetical protein BJF93_01685 [Xaviernesmea oryzae]SEM20375.1 autotransporter-associated beta strand repeat-containing protein [Xaviernesmea oryzae]